MNILTFSHTITLCDMFVLNQRPCTGNLIIGSLRIIYFLEMRNCSVILAIALLILILALKESSVAQNSLELKLPSRFSPPFYAKQRILSPEKKKMDIKIDYAQLPAGPASGPSPELLAPAV